MREWLKKAREDKKMTMKELAAKLHISESYYCSIENGYRQRNMDISLADRLSDILEIPLKEILKSEAELRDSGGTA